MRLTSPEKKVATGREGLAEFVRGKGDHEFHFGHVESEISIGYSGRDVK